MKKRLFYGSFILLECVVWGLGNPVIKIAMQTLPPFTSIALRFSLALLIFLVFFGRHVRRNLQREKLLPLLVVSLFTALAFILGSFALMLTDAIIAGFLMGIAVIFTPFLEPLLLHTRFRWKILPLVAVVCLGMYLLCGGGSLSFGWGECMAILCSLSFAIMLTLSEKYVGDIDTITLSTMQCLVAAVLGIALALIFEGVWDVRTLTPGGAGAIAYLAIASTCIAYILQNKAMRHISATFASIAFCTEPVFTALFAYILLGERLTVTGMVGAGILFVGILAASVLKD